MLLMSTSVLAQLPQKGDWLVGTDVASLNIPVLNQGIRRVSSADVALIGGKFMTKQLVIGTALPIEWQSIPVSQPYQRATTLAYGLVPFARFYLTNSRVRPYLSVGAGYLFTRYTGERKTSHNGVTYSGNVGLAYFFNRHVSLDAVADFTSQPYQAQNTFAEENDNQLNFHLRFQVILGK